MSRLLVLAICLAACDGGNPTSPCADLGGDMGGACVVPPSAPLARSTCSDPATQGLFCDPVSGSTPNLACLATSVDGGVTPSSTDRLPMSGFVNVFATGPDTNHVTVSAFTTIALQTGADPGQLTPVEHVDVCYYFAATPACTADTDCATGTCLDNGFCAPDKFDTTKSCVLATADDLLACDADPTLGCVAPKLDGCATACDDGLAGRVDRQKYCHPTADGTGSCRPRARWQVRYPTMSVPADQPVAIRVSGASSASDARFASTVTPNVFVTMSRPCTSAGQTDCWDAGKNVYRRDVVAMSQVDYDSIAVNSGLVAGIAPGHGAILGEVHDCDGVRLANAQVVAQPVPGRSTYFSDAIPAQPVPDVTRAARGTDARGLYAELDLVPGLVTVTPWGYVSSGGALETLGAVEVRVYANTYTLIDVGGGRP